MSISTPWGSSPRGLQIIIPLCFPASWFPLLTLYFTAKSCLMKLIKFWVNLCLLTLWITGLSIVHRNYWRRIRRLASFPDYLIYSRLFPNPHPSTPFVHFFPQQLFCIVINAYGPLHFHRAVHILTSNARTSYIAHVETFASVLRHTRVESWNRKRPPAVRTGIPASTYDSFRGYANHRDILESKRDDDSFIWHLPGVSRSLSLSIALFLFLNLTHYEQSFGKIITVFTGREYVIIMCHNRQC